MDLLFIAPYVPNVIRVRPFNLIRSLSSAGHHVTVLTLWSSERDRQEIRNLEQHCHQIVAVQLSKWRSLLNCLAALPSSAPLQAAYSWHPDLQNVIEALLGDGSENRYHAVHVEHMRGARYALAVQRALGTQTKYRKPRPAIVWDSVDCITRLFRQASIHSKRKYSRWITRLELGRTERFERHLSNQFDHILVTSAKDREALLELSRVDQRGTPISVVTNGVDHDYFSPDEQAVRVPNSLILSGKMSYHANVTMAIYLVEEIMPLVWKRRPATQVFIVGKDPTPEVRQLAAKPQVQVTGTVQDIREYLRQATISVVPITYGAGIQNKILEAMACGAPVITSRHAIDALDAENGRQLMIADHPAEFARAILFLLENPALRRELAARGRDYVLAKHNWKSIADRLVGIYTESFNLKNQRIAQSTIASGSKKALFV